jgi:hypothetical protein
MNEQMRRRCAQLSAGVLVVGLGVGAQGCARDGERGKDRPESSAAANDASAAAETSASAAPTALPRGAAPSDGSGPGAAPGGIEAKLVDVQLFHPSSYERALRSVRDTGEPQLDPDSRSFARSPFGIGVILEATNGTEHLLREPKFEGEVVFLAATGKVTCKVQPAYAMSGWDGYATVVSYFKKPSNGAPTFGTTTPPTWWDESEDRWEAVWRPSERIRMVGRADCDSLLLSDLAPNTIDGSIEVSATRRFSPNPETVYTSERYQLTLLETQVRIVDRVTKKATTTPLANIASLDPPEGPELKRIEVYRPPLEQSLDVVTSPPVTFNVHPHSLLVQTVKRPSGELVPAMGNMLVFLEKDQLTFRDAAREGLSMHTWERSDVPETSPPVELKEQEFSARVTKYELIHFADDPTLSKGRRSLKITWQLSLPQSALDARLKAPVDAASSGVAQAEQALAALGEGAEPAALAKAKTDIASAKAAYAAAEARYKAGVTSERQRLARTLNCGDIRVVTTRRSEERPTNAADATKLCGELAKNDAVEVTLNYVLGRYEIPVALFYRNGLKPALSPIASTQLSKLDPR